MLIRCAIGIPRLNNLPVWHQRLNLFSLAGVTRPYLSRSLRILELYDNPPGAMVTVIAFYSKNEYSCLTEEGYKLATRLGTRVRRIPEPRIHISGGTFHQSPVAVGTQVSQTVNISASSDELLARLREEVQERADDEQRRSEILLHIDALEEAKGKPSLMARYNDLVGVIGNHVTVFGPLLTLLLQRLMAS